MSNSDWISLGSAIATIIGVGVALFINSQQIRKMSNQLIVQQFSDYTKRYQEIILHFPENINEVSFDFATTLDKNTTMRYMRAYFDLCYEEWYLSQRNLIDVETWGIWKGGMKTAIKKTAFFTAWSSIKRDTNYGKQFENFLENLIPED